MQTRGDKYKAWWREKTKGRTLFFACAPTPEGASPMFPAPDCTKVKHAFSAVFSRGRRYYAFATAEERDLFVLTHHEAQTCMDPLAPDVPTKGIGLTGGTSPGQGDPS